MTPLERKYRRLVSLLPGWYRQQHEEALVSTLLARTRATDAELDDHRSVFGWPRLRDYATVVTLATRLRLGGEGAPAQSRAIGDGARRFALLGLLAHALTGTVDLAQGLWLGGVLPMAIPVGRSTPTTAPGLAIDPAAVVTALAWLAAFFTLIGGRRRVARVSASIALLALCWWTLLATPSAGLGQWFAVASPLLVASTTVLAMSGFHEAAPRIRGRPWLVSYMAALTVVMVAQAWAAQGQGLPLWVDLPGAYVTLAVMMAAAHLVKPLITSGGPDPAWSVALASFATVAAAARALSTTAYAGAGGAYSQALAAGYWQTAAAGLVAVTLAIVAHRSIRRLSAGPAE